MEPGSSSSLGLTDFHEPLTNDQKPMEYDEAFPALPPNPSGPNSGPTSGLSSPGASSKWSQKMRIGSNIVTSVFNIPFEERSDRGHGDRFGEMDAVKACAEITKQTDAHIEMSSSSRDQSLTFLITGKQPNVLSAKREILSRFQTQAQVQINIPKEHHRVILGAKGANLEKLEKSTATKISVPRPNEDSNILTIVGPREGIEKAVHEIRVVSDNLSKQASERINIPKKYHPFICGPHNQKIDKLSEETGVKIHVPPPSAANNEIFVAGEKNGVAVAANALNKSYEDCKRYSCVSVEVGRNQHKYIIGPRRVTINEILAKTGVSVEMPATDTSDTITLRGPPEALGNALTLVYEKANSVVSRVVEASDWLHKYIVGRKGINIKTITMKYPKSHVEIKDNQINIEGPPDEVNAVAAELQANVDELTSTLAFREIQVDPKHHKHIIGKAGVNVNRLRDETGVTISVKDINSPIIYLEGSKAGVETAATRLLEQVEKLDNEKEKDLIIEHRFHGNLIGSKGEKIREIRDKCNQVQINFPAPGEKRDVVTVRGPKDDVEKCCKYITQLYNEMKENSYQLKVAVFPQCYKHLIGKSGQNIRQIRDETKTWIDLPPFDEKKTKSEAEVIVITGRKDNCEAARDKILILQNSMADVIEVNVMIPNKVHNLLIGAGGKLVRSISEDCGGVQIKFPEAKAKSDRVILTGLKDDVEKAKTTLLELSREREENSYTETIEAKAQHHRFLIGKNGSNIRRIRDLTGARVLFPNENDAGQDIITIIGKKEGVIEAKKQLVDTLKELEKVTESEINVDPKYHRHFVLRRGEVLRQISDELGGVSISFPKVGSNSSHVSVKGAPECVEAAKKKIAAIVDELEQRITIEVHIEQKHHRTIMGARGSKVQNIQSEFNVDIKFPERAENSDALAEQNGDCGNVSSSDVIRVSGKPESCENAKQALLDQVPVTVEVDVPFELHRFIIGAKGKDVRELMSRYDVHITVPASDRQSDTIQILGSPKNAAAAKEALIAIREEREQEKRTKELKSYEVKIQVDPEYHPKIIGHKGAVITKIRDKYNVNIQLPKKNLPEEDIITITGFEEQANAARDEILAIVKELCDKVKEEVEIDHRVHSRIIGARGKNVRQIMTDFEVDIRFPRSTDSNPNLVVISGSDADKVYDAKEHLLNLEEEFMQDVSENEYMQSFVRGSGQAKQQGLADKQSNGPNGFVVKGAPWEQAPDTQSNEEFPSFGNGVANASATKPISSAWGARKHF